jgi:hypothetical protein
MGGTAVRAVVFFGSHKTKPSDDPWSAWDFFVVVDDYRRYFAALAGAGVLHRAAGTMSVLARWLPPTQLSLRAGLAGRTLRAKCAVISFAHLERETGPRRRDHFCAGRLFQPVEIAWTATDADREQVLDALGAAHRATLEWGRPWLPARFTPEEYAARLIEVSLAGEIRPEPPARASALFDGQRGYHGEVFGALLAERAAAGELDEEAGRYALRRPAPPLERLRLRLYFLRSLVRATQRWAKHMLTFEDWLDYLVHKAVRHGAAPVVLSARERRWPLVFLWPRVIRHLRAKDRPR